jgi:hypothetical protein
MDLGVEMAKAELGDANYRAEHKLAPHWMSRRTHRQPHLANYSNPPRPFPETHEWVKLVTKPPITRADGKELTRSRCEICMEKAAEAGAGNKNFTPGGTQLVPTIYGCAVCKRFICRVCYESGAFKSWRHPGDESAPFTLHSNLG